MFGLQGPSAPDPRRAAHLPARQRAHAGAPVRHDREPHRAHSRRQDRAESAPETDHCRAQGADLWTHRGEG